MSSSYPSTEIVRVDDTLRQNLKALVERYFEVDTDMKRLRNEMADLRRSKTALAAQIMAVMRNTGLEEVRCSGSRLALKSREVKLPPTREIIRERLEKLFPDGGDRVEGGLLQVVLAPRTVEARSSIRRIRVR